MKEISGSLKKESFVELSFGLLNTLGSFEKF